VVVSNAVGLDEVNPDNFMKIFLRILKMTVGCRAVFGDIPPIMVSMLQQYTDYEVYQVWETQNLDGTKEFHGFCSIGRH